MPRANPIKLSMVSAHKLVDLLLREFTAKRMSYREFAEYASKELGFRVTFQQVQTRVVEFEIPHGQPPEMADITAMGSMVLAHDTVIHTLEERLAILEAWVNNTFPSKSPLKVVG